MEENARQDVRAVALDRVNTSGCAEVVRAAADEAPCRPPRR